MLLERDDELDLLRAALQQAASGHGGTVVITGPPGIGRTCLLAAFGAGLSSHPVGPAGAQPVVLLQATGAVPEQQFACGVLRQLVGTAPDLEHGHPPLDSLLDHSRELPAGAALLLLVDDADMADDRSLEHLYELSRQAPSHQILLVCTVGEGRAGAGRPPMRRLAARARTVVPLRRLSRPSIARLVREHYATAGPPADVAPEIIDVIDRCTRGNPLELVALLAEAGRHGLPPHAEAATVLAELRPARSRRMLQLALDGQPDAVLTTARALAILGPRTQPEHLRALTGQDQVALDAALWRLRELDRIPATGALRLSDPLFHEVVLSSASAGELNALHLAAAALLHTLGSDTGVCAEHLLAVTTRLDAQQRRWLCRAAALRAAAGDPGRAVRYLRRALADTPPGDADRAALQVGLAAVERANTVGPVARLLHQAVTQMTDVGQQAEAILLLSPDLDGWAGLPLAELVPPIAEALGPASQLSGADEQRALGLEGWHRRCSDDDPATLAGARDRWDGLPSRLRDPAMCGEGGRRLLAALLHAMAVTARLPARELAQVAGTIVDHEPASACQLHGVLPVLADCLLAADQLHDLLPWADAVRRDVERAAGPAQRLAMTAELTLIALARGRHGAATELARTLASHPSDDLVTRRVVLALAACALETRDLTLGAEVLTRARSRLTHPRDLALISILDGAQAAERGEHPAAAHLFLCAAHLLERAGWSGPAVQHWVPWVVRSQARSGEQARAASLARWHVQQARNWGAPRSLGRALLVLAPFADTEACLREAVDVLRHSADQRSAALALLRYAHQVGPAAPGEVTACLADAAALAARCGDTRLLEQIWAAGAPTPSDPLLLLTAAERTVAGLVAQGLSNQAIADLLGVTRRAIEKHLTSCYRKTSSTGRADLVAAMRADAAPLPQDLAAGPDQVLVSASAWATASGWAGDPASSVGDPGGLVTD